MPSQADLASPRPSSPSASTSTAALFCLSLRYGLISLSRFESSGALVVGLAPCGTGHTSFDLCRYKSTHVCSTIRLGIDEMNVTSLVDKESRKRSSILRKKKKEDNWEGCTGSVALSSLKSMGTPTPTWARVGRRWLDVGRQVTRVVTTTTSRFASASRTPPGPAAAAVREASRRGYLRPGCALAAATDSLHHHHHEKSFESLGLSGSILEALNEIGEHPPSPFSLSLCALSDSAPFWTDKAWTRLRKFKPRQSRESCEAGRRWTLWVRTGSSSRLRPGQERPWPTCYP